MLQTKEMFAPGQRQTLAALVPWTLLALVWALFCWFVIFAWQPLNFWLLMSLAQLSFSAIAFALRGRFLHLPIRPADVALGIVSAALLYGVFELGNWIAPFLIPNAHGQVGNIYGLKSHLSPVVLAPLLLLVIGPSEEIFWRGLVQTTLSARWGKNAGFVVTNAIYGLIHLVSGNIMLVLAALVAGFFWGFMYRWLGRLWPNLFSHALWDMFVMALFPI